MLIHSSSEVTFTLRLNQVGLHYALTTYRIGHLRLIMSRLTGFLAFPISLSWRAGKIRLSDVVLFLRVGVASRKGCGIGLSYGGLRINTLFSQFSDVPHRILRLALSQSGGAISMFLGTAALWHVSHLSTAHFWRVRLRRWAGSIKGIMHSHYSSVRSEG